MAQAFGHQLRRLAGLLAGRAGPPGTPIAPPAAPAARGLDPAGAAVARSAHVVDAATRTFWQRGAASSETLVEAARAPVAASIGSKVDVLAREQPLTGRPARAHGGPADPAFVEIALVELLRGGSFDRAFALLAPECRAAWGSAATFAQEHRETARLLRGAVVDAARPLAVWDDESGQRHHDVAELEVAYTLACADRVRTLHRTVHLVRAEGGWRSLVFPAPPR